MSHKSSHTFNPRIEKKKKATPDYKKLGSGGIFVLIAILIGIAISQYLRDDGLPSKVRPYVNEANKQSLNAVDESLKELNVFFEQAKTNARPFADAATGWRSKGLLMLDAAGYAVSLGGLLSGGGTTAPPFPAGDLIAKSFAQPASRHERYIKAKFDEMIFSEEQLAKAVEDTVARFFQHLNSIDNKMLVDIRADISDIAKDSPFSSQDEQDLLKNYHEAIENISNQSANKNISEIGTSVASIIVAEVLTQVAVRLAVSSGILGAGTASAPYTLGIGIIVGIIVDQIIATVWDLYADPKGSLAAKIVEDINTIQTLLIDGAPATNSTASVIGLRKSLTDYARQHHEHRKTAIKRFLTP